MTMNPASLRPTSDDLGLNDLAAALRELRHARGLSQKELAALLGIARQRISMAETGAYFPSAEMVIRYARELDAPREALLDKWEDVMARTKWDVRASTVPDEESGNPDQTQNPDETKNLRRVDCPTLFGPNGEVLHADDPLRGRILREVATVSDAMIRELALYPGRMQSLSGERFEEFVAELLSRQGYDVALSKGSWDGGVDIFVVEKSALGSFLYLVECKRWAPNRRVSGSVVQRLLATVNLRRATAGVVATTSGFSAPARQAAAQVPFTLTLKDFNGVHEWALEAWRKRLGISGATADGRAFEGPREEPLRGDPGPS